MHKPNIKNLKKRKVYSSFKDSIWDADFADMFIVEYNKGIQFLLCVTDIYSKYAWVVPLEDKKGITITNAFQKIVDKSERRPNKIWFDKRSEFYKRLIKSWLQDNDIKIYSIHNKGKFVIADRYIRNLTNIIYKHKATESKIVYIGKLVDTIHKYNNTYHRTIKMNPNDINKSTYIDFSIENDEKYLKFKVGDCVRISKYKNILAEGYIPIWSEEVFVIKKIKNTVL